MTTEEKAKELVDKFIQYAPVEFEEEYAKRCALIAVDEIIAVLDKLLHSQLNNDFDILAEKAYLMEVKQHIEKL